MLPGFLYAAWVTIALWDLIRQESVPDPVPRPLDGDRDPDPAARADLYYAFGTLADPEAAPPDAHGGWRAAYVVIAALAAVFGG